jgi:hypothetical protein
MSQPISSVFVCLFKTGISITLIFFKFGNTAVKHDWFDRKDDHSSFWGRGGVVNRKASGCVAVG